MRWFQRFMYGRRGTDSLNLALVVASIVCTLLASILGWFASNTVLVVIYMFLQFISTVLLAFAVFRMFSRNISAREREDRAYKNFIGKFKQSRKKRADRKQFLYFKCESCGAELRVPRGKGKIIVTCPRCRHETTTKS